MEQLWMVFQVLIGYNLILPLILFLFWVLLRKPSKPILTNISPGLPDYGIIVTAFEQVDTIPAVVDSILKSKYGNFKVYIVADKCDVSSLRFSDDRVIILRPPDTLASNTASHSYAFTHFSRQHDYVTIIDSDNIVDHEYLTQLTKTFDEGYSAVQGIRHAKNLNTNVACLDAARDLYYHFYDGIVLYELGSSATLSGSGMAFTASLYFEFLQKHKVSGAGFDKVLQNFIVDKGLRIAFNQHAILYDEKTTRETQLVNQRSRWINTWFKYFTLGFKLIFKGLFRLNFNQFLFGVTLIRPPLFMFLLVSLVCLLLNLVFSPFVFLIWLLSFVIFTSGFLIALRFFKADQRIYHSLSNIPKFVYLQLKSLARSRNANKHSIATEHYVIDSSETSKNSNENGS